MFLRCIFAFTLLTTAAHADPLAVSNADLELIKAEVAWVLSEPTSAELSDVQSAVGRLEDGPMVWVCGFIRGDNRGGGSAEPLPFMGALGTSQVGERIFALVDIADPDPSSHSRVLAGCRERMRTTD